jgi:hypothetical protein
MEATAKDTKPLVGPSASLNGGHSTASNPPRQWSDVVRSGPEGTGAHPTGPVAEKALPWSMRNKPTSGRAKA